MSDEMSVMPGIEMEKEEKSSERKAGKLMRENGEKTNDGRKLRKVE